MWLVSLNNFDLFFQLQPLRLIFPLAHRFWAPWLWPGGGRAKHKPQSEPPASPARIRFPFPVIQASGAISTSRCQVNINPEATAPGSLRNTEEHCRALPGGCTGQGGERGRRRKFHVVPLITGWKERGESSNTAPPARQGSPINR